MEPIILLTEANIWCIKITVHAKWVTTRVLTMTQSRWESVGQGLSIKLTKDKVSAVYSYWIGSSSIPLS